MGIALLATFRETIEASLIIAASYLSLKESQRLKEARWLWYGSLLGGVAALAFACMLFTAITGTEGQEQEWIDGTISIAAATLLLWTAWHTLRGSDRTALAAEKSALFLLSFITVARDATEIALMLLPLTRQFSYSVLCVQAVTGCVTALLAVFLLLRGIIAFPPRIGRLVTNTVLLVLILYFLIDGITSFL